MYKNFRKIICKDCLLFSIQSPRLRHLHRLSVLSLHEYTWDQTLFILVLNELNIILPLSSSSLLRSIHLRMQCLNLSIYKIVNFVKLKPKKSKISYKHVQWTNVISSNVLKCLFMGWNILLFKMIEALPKARLSTQGSNFFL